MNRTRLRNELLLDMSICKDDRIENFLSFPASL